MPGLTGAQVPSLPPVLAWLHAAHGPPHAWSQQSPSVQLPPLPPVLAWLHAAHGPPHAWSQQSPSVQLPLRQSPGALHGSPSGFLAHWPP
ncbi:MAG: hypothetical protein HY744_01545 [Deltaproteobacteria bacterium]|nr:hypothetical protein [Deltaproteobacteria bacterium]